MEYNTLIITHANCGDGVAAATAFTKEAYAWVGKRLSVTDYRSKLFPNIDPNSVKIHSTHERNFVDDKRMPSHTGKIVIILDYTYPMETLLEIKSRALSLHVFDHHPVLGDASALPDWYYLDQTRCASRIIWNKLHTVEPWFIPHIEDRDLWLDRNAWSREFSSAFYFDGIRIATLIKYLDYIPTDILAHYSKGNILNMANTVTLEQFLFLS
jgi:hypothetical protein